MTADTGLPPDMERVLADWFQATAPRREPADLLDRVLTRTAGVRRRPSWWQAGSWLDVLDRPRWLFGRAITIGTVVALLVALVAVMLTAASRPPFPMPLGRNGLLLAAAPGQLLLLDGNGAVVRRAATGDQFGQGAWSHDGTRLAHAEGSSASPNLVITDADLGELLRIDLPADTVPSFSWSPDDRHITFGTDTANGARAYVIDVAAGAVARPITDVALHAVMPVWSPDGGLIALRGGVSVDQLALYVVRPDGSALVRLSHQASAVEQCKISWTPDGQSIVFATAAGVYVAWRIDRDGSNETMLTSAADTSFCPSVSPDGTRIAVAQWLSTGKYVTIRSIDGSGPSRPDGPLWDSWPGVWSPDGSTIAINGRTLDGSPDPRAFLDANGAGPARTFLADGADVVDWQRLAR